LYKTYKGVCYNININEAGSDNLNDVGLFAAFIGGVLSFFSPCVLPLIPIYISYLTGSSIEEIKSGDKSARIKLYINSLGFLLGLITIFVSLGLTFTTIGTVLAKNTLILRKVSGVIIIILGLFHIGLFKISFLKRDYKFKFRSKGVGFFNSYLLGLAFSFGWTPCVGTILGTILNVAMLENNISAGMILLVFYSIGFSVPFIFSTLFIEKLLTKIGNSNKYMNTIKYVTGILIIIMGVLVYFDKIDRITAFFS